MIFDFNQQQIQEAISSPIPDYINNLRGRDLFLKQDCFRRGKLAEIWFRDFFEFCNFQVCSNLKNGNKDIDLSIMGVFLNGQSISFDRTIKIEVKTSLIPHKNFDINEQGDLKIYVNSDDPINDIDWDMGIQVYYTKFKKEWEQNIPNFDSNLISEYKKLNFSCSWVCKNATIQYLNGLPIDKMTWQYGDKIFWHCPLKIHNHNIYEIFDLFNAYSF